MNLLKQKRLAGLLFVQSDLYKDIKSAAHLPVYAYCYVCVCECKVKLFLI